ncbi:MAG TPA: hypothetical protein VFJ24_09770 [Gaiellales bacterium]|nr:hypothetical protein [Gaiellales bacterium]
MRHLPRATGFWTRGVVVAALVVIAAVGFCMFESDHDGDHHHVGSGSIHVCLAMLASGLAPLAFTALLAVGSAIVLPAPRWAIVTLGVALPPPKSTISL